MFHSMHIAVIHIQVKPENLQPFIAATVANARASRGEPGVVRFDVIQQADDPTRFVLVEVYRDAAANAAHKETPHYFAWRDAATPLMAAPRTRAEYKNISPDDQNW